MGAIDGALRLTRAAVTLAEDVARAGGRTVETAMSSAATTVARRVGLQAADSTAFTILRGEGSIGVRLFERVGEMTGANAGMKATHAALAERLATLETAHVAAQGEIGSLRTANTALSERLATAGATNTALQGEVASLRTANGELTSKLAVATRPRNGLVQLPSYYTELRKTHEATVSQLQHLQQAHTALQTEHAALQAAQPTGIRGLLRKITG